MNKMILRIRESNFRKITFYKVRLRLQQNHNITTDVYTADSYTCRYTNTNNL